MTTRDERLHAERAGLLAIRESSTIFEVDESPTSLDHFFVRFRGQGLQRDAASGLVTEIDVHELETRLPIQFPKQPPDIRWRTPNFHPNFSFGGFIRLADVGLTWHEELRLDAIVDRLWDAARWAYVNDERIVNRAAKVWLETDSRRTLPIDPRPLLDRRQMVHSNIVRYRRRGDRPLQMSAAGPDREVFFIGDEPTAATENGTDPSAPASLYFIDDEPPSEDR